jgi:hypothetical protein
MSKAVAAAARTLADALDYLEAVDVQLSECCDWSPGSRQSAAGGRTPKPMPQPSPQPAPPLLLPDAGASAGDKSRRGHAGTAAADVDRVSGGEDGTQETSLHVTRSNTVPRTSTMMKRDTHARGTRRSVGPGPPDLGTIAIGTLKRRASVWGLWRGSAGRGGIEAALDAGPGLRGCGREVGADGAAGTDAGPHTTSLEARSLCSVPEATQVIPFSISRTIELS